MTICDFSLNSPPRLQKLYTRIEKKMESVEDDSAEWSPQVGDICLALFSFDSR